jgi:threonine-phosphate decarboxylase
MSRSCDHGGIIFSVARTLGVAPDQILDFSASINPLGMSPAVREALVRSLDILVHYPDSSHAELKQALAEYHGLSPDCFTIANGSTELIYQLPAMLSGKKALILAPAFSEYVRALQLHRWETEYFFLKPDDRFSIDTDKLEQALSGGVDLLYCCNPGNPFGMLYPYQVIETIFRLCEAAGTYLVLDEAFMDFCETGSAKRMVVLSDSAVILRSMTKFFGFPGLRLGYAISSSAVADRLGSMGGPWNVNSLALAAGSAALRDCGHNRDTIDFIRQERCALIEGIARFDRFRIYPSDVNYLLIEIRDGISSGELRERLLLHRILIRDCADFAGLSSRFFRIAVRTGAENTRLLECIDKVLK